MSPTDDRVPILYLAPWVDIGGSDKGTIDWFRFLDRDRFRASLITTQPSPNRRLEHLSRYADEVWDLPDLMPGDEFARFILTFIHTRRIKLLHVMNSRLTFELLPDIASLPDRPRVVVQLHVEEPDRSGYVRYVTTRYGNLVDAFSVSSQALSERLDAYEVPLAKRKVIQTGVDAVREFAPARVTPTEGLDPSALNVLFPARLTAQKDPFLMVEVAAKLRARGLKFRFHVLGEGVLRDDISERVRELGLGREVMLYGERVDIAPWYAACDLVLLTSEFEGVPYVAYEAMAMATPVVGPDLPGLRELLTPDTGVLVSPRDDAAAYAAAIAELAADPAARKAIGEAGRQQALTEHTLERMAAEHGSLYYELLQAPTGPELSAEPDPQPGFKPRSATQSALRNRRPRSRPLVSVVVPCFNHGRYLPDCLESIAAQSYESVETIVVDNASTDPETLEVFSDLEREDRVKVLRLNTNRGPSPARNAAIEHAQGRYVLPVDADNRLLPNAVSSLVEQLSSAGERIGFIYPNYQFFGNRRDYFEPPSYNLHRLLAANYCDTSSLLDREIFDRGFRYPEDIVLGFEDWDLVLSLAEHGIYGEPARTPTLLYRRHGFTRVDLVEAASVPFTETIVSRHPLLFQSRVRVKAEWSPAVSVIALDALDLGADDALGNLVVAAARQTCLDFELVVRTDGDVRPTELGPRLHRVPSELAASRAQALAQGHQVAKGRYVLATYGSVATALADPALIEKALRVLRANPRIDALAFAEGESSTATLRLLDAEAVQRARPSALLWASGGSDSVPGSLELPGQRPLETIARWLSAHHTVQWRHMPRPDRRLVAADRDAPGARLGAPRQARARDAHNLVEPALVPGLPPGVATRVSRQGVWMPLQSRVLCRHLHHATGRYFITNSRVPPPGCSLQHDLGCLRGLEFAGTVSLVKREQNGQTEFAVREPIDLDAPALLGFVEQAPLPLFDPLQVARVRTTGQRVLISGASDPIFDQVDDVTFIGFIEPYPIHPRQPPHEEVSYGLVGLVRTVDLQARCHRYGAGSVPAGEPGGELGAMLAEPMGDCEPLFCDGNGRVSSPLWPSTIRRPPLRSAVRWTGGPITWKKAGAISPRIRATVRRAYDSAQIMTARSTTSVTRPPSPAGYLLRSPTNKSIPLYAGLHPVTGDQLLSTDEREPGRLGYRGVMQLGHLIADAPVTGTLGPVRTGVPWASRFGRSESAP